MNVPDRATVAIIGAGPAGLATSRKLTDEGIDHVLIERGRVAERWRSERWDSLRLLTPNWQTRLPGWEYEGDDPDGYMTMPEVVRYLDDYARSFDAPVIDETMVSRVGPTDGGFRVSTSRGEFDAAAVVVAVGAAPNIPSWSADLPAGLDRLHSCEYRNPESLAAGGVVVVGASASGLQLADELRRAGREVVLSVGEHTRLPRTYRGRDIHWWLDLTGTLDLTIDQVRDVEAARRAPSLQLVGTPDQRSIDLNALAASGIRLAGRAAGFEGRSLKFDDDLSDNAGRADRRLGRLLDLFDAHAAVGRFDDELEPVTRPEPTDVPTPALTEIDIDARGIRTVLWATGFAGRYPWLDVPVFDDRGQICHDGGVTDWPGLYTMGLPFMRRRKSTFLDGFGADAADIVDHIAAHLAPERIGA